MKTEVDTSWNPFVYALRKHSNLASHDHVNKDGSSSWKAAQELDKTAELSMEATVMEKAGRRFLEMPRELPALQPPGKKRICEFENKGLSLFLNLSSLQSEPCLLQPIASHTS